MWLENNTLQSFRSMIQIGSRIYFLSCLGNELWLFDLNDKSLKMKLKLSNLKGSYDAVYREIVKYNDMLIFVPNSANDICIYDIETELIRKIPVPNISIPYKYMCKFSNAFCTDKHIFLIPHCYPAVLVIDAEIWQIVICKTLYTGDKLIESELFSGSYILREDKCYIPSAQFNEVVEMDIKTCTVKRHSLGKEIAWYGSISYYDGSIWLTGKKSTITKWDIVHDLVEELDYPKCFIKQENSYPFLDTFYWMNKVILIPKKANMYIIIDMETKKIEGFQRKQEYLCFSLIYSENNQYKLLYDVAQTKLFLMNEEKEEVAQMKIDLCLKMYMQKIINEDISNRKKGYDKSLCGNIIYEICD